MSFRQFICRLQEQSVFVLQVLCKSSQEQKQKDGVDNQRQHPVEPEQADNGEDDKIDRHDLQDHPVRPVLEIQMQERVILIRKEFFPFPEHTGRAFSDLLSAPFSVADPAEQPAGQRSLAPVGAFHAYDRPQGRERPEENAKHTHPHQNIHQHPRSGTQTTSLHRTVNHRPRHPENICCHQEEQDEHRNLKGYPEHFHLADIQPFYTGEQKRRRDHHKDQDLKHIPERRQRIQCIQPCFLRIYCLCIGRQAVGGHPVDHLNPGRLCDRSHISPIDRILCIIQIRGL